MRSNPKDFELFTCSVRDGLQISARKYGWENREKPPIICLADLARNSADFHELALFLMSSKGGNRRVLAVDCRGRGASAHDKHKANYSLDVEADDLLSLTTALDIHQFDIIGIARGGLIALLLGGLRAGSLRRIVLNDIGPQVDAHGLIYLKKLYEQFKLCKRLSDVEGVLQTFGERHFPALDSTYWQLEASRLFEEVDGKLTPKNDAFISGLISGMDLDARPSEFWPQFIGISQLPVMLIRGELSGLLKDDIVEKMTRIHSNMKLVNVPGQGHAPKLETGGLPEKISEFLK